MKMIGFKKEYDKHLINSKYIYETSDKNLALITTEEKVRVLKYLGESDMIFSKTLALYDGENYIGPYMIFSDGEWIWPNYFSYNLTNKDSINYDFLAHLRLRNHTIVPLTWEQKQKATIFLEKEMLNI